MFTIKYNLTSYTVVIEIICHHRLPHHISGMCIGIGRFNYIIFGSNMSPIVQGCAKSTGTLYNNFVINTHIDITTVDST